MKVLIWGDTQLDQNPPYSKINPATGRSIRFEEDVALMKGIVTAAIAKGATAMIHLGDLTEHKDPKSLESEAAAEIFRIMLDAGGSVYAVAGNHDGSVFDVTSSSFGPLARMAGTRFKLFHGPEYFAPLRMLALPYIHKATPLELKQAIREAYDRQVEADPDYAFHSAPIFLAVHYGLKGAKLGSRNMVLPSDYLSEEELLAGAGGDSVDFVFAGHIHKAQEVRIGHARGIHPGSPVICDMGERLDLKTYAIFDTETRAVEIIPIQQAHRWVETQWPIDQIHAGKVGWPWAEGDIVKFVGEREKGQIPNVILEKGFENGIPIPFSFSTADIRTAKPPREVRDFAIDTSGGFVPALHSYVAKMWGVALTDVQKRAFDMALAAINETALPVYCRTIRPVSIDLTNFMTFPSYHHEFHAGDPVLFSGKSGIGKTNFMEAMLVLTTGETSKEAPPWTVVRQGEKSCLVVGEFVGQGDGGEQRFRISFSVALTFMNPQDESERPKAETDLVVETWVDGAWSKKNLLNTGGLRGIRNNISHLFGGGYLTLRTTNFQFQKNRNAFIEAKPEDRKGALGEVCGLEPLTKAGKALEKIRIESAGKVKDASQRLSGMEAVAESNDTALETAKAGLEDTTKVIAGMAFSVEESEKEHLRIQQLEEKARNEVNWQETKVSILPNTSTPLAEAEAEQRGLVDGYEKARKSKLDEHATTKADVEKAEADLAALIAPTQRDVEVAEQGLEKAEADLAAAEIEAEEAKNAAQRADTDLAPARLKRRALDGKDLKECPTCKHEVDASHIAEEIAALDAEIERLTPIFTAANAEATRTRENVVALKTGVRVSRDALDMVRKDFAKPTALRERLKTLKENLDKIVEAGKTMAATFETENAKALEKVAEAQRIHNGQEAVSSAARERLTTLRAELDAAIQNTGKAAGNLKDARHDHATALAKAEGLRTDIARLEGQAEALRKAREEIKVLEATAEACRLAAELMDPKAGLPVFLIDEQLYFLEDRVNHFFTRLGGKRLIMELVTQKADGKETLDILIDNGRPGPRLDARCFSGGQRDMIESALKHAMAELKTAQRGITFEYQGIDEPTGGFDSEGKASLVSLLYEDVLTYPVICLVSHDPEIRNVFEHRVNFIQGPDQETLEG